MACNETQRSVFYVLFPFPQQQQPIYSFETSSDYVFDVQWSPVHPSVFASVDGQGKVDIWNLNTDTEVPVLSETVDSVSAINRVRWSHSGQQLACGNADGTVYIYDTGEVGCVCAHMRACVCCTENIWAWRYADIFFLCWFFFVWCLLRFSPFRFCHFLAALPPATSGRVEPSEADLPRLAGDGVERGQLRCSSILASSHPFRGEGPSHTITYIYSSYWCDDVSAVLMTRSTSKPACHNLGDPFLFLS